MGNQRHCLNFVVLVGSLLCPLGPRGPVAVAEHMVATTYIRLSSAQASSFFPSVGPGGQREFSPEKALSRGSGYWCSEGNHRKEDVVSWTGRSKTRRSVEGIEINWAYAPGKGRRAWKRTFLFMSFYRPPWSPVAVLASFDGAEPFQEVVPFQDVNSAGREQKRFLIFCIINLSINITAQFRQVLTFARPVYLKAARILMKDPQSQYFGISLVQLLGSGFPILRIQSGITSPHQAC